MTTDLPPSPTIRQAKWDEAFRGADYLNRVWAHATSKGQAEVRLRVPTGFVATMAEAILHMANHAVPLYRLHTGVEERLVGMMDQAAQAQERIHGATERALMAISELEALVERRRPKRWVAPVRPAVHGCMGFGA